MVIDQNASPKLFRIKILIIIATIYLIFTVFQVVFCGQQLINAWNHLYITVFKFNSNPTDQAFVYSFSVVETEALAG